MSRNLQSLSFGKTKHREFSQGLIRAQCTRVSTTWDTQSEIRTEVILGRSYSKDVNVVFLSIWYNRKVDGDAQQKRNIVAWGTSQPTTMPNISHSPKTLNCVVERSKDSIYSTEGSRNLQLYSISFHNNPSTTSKILHLFACAVLVWHNHILHVALNSQISHRCYSRYWIWEDVDVTDWRIAFIWNKWFYSQTFPQNRRVYRSGLGDGIEAALTIHHYSIRPTSYQYNHTVRREWNTRLLLLEGGELTPELDPSQPNTRSKMNSIRQR